MCVHVSRGTCRLTCVGVWAATPQRSPRSRCSWWTLWWLSSVRSSWLGSGCASGCRSGPDESDLRNFNEPCMFQTTDRQACVTQSCVRWDITHILKTDTLNFNMHIHETSEIILFLRSSFCRGRAVSQQCFALCRSCNETGERKEKKTQKWTACIKIK